MKIETVLGGCTTLIHGRNFPMGSIVLSLNNGMKLVCMNFNHSKKEPLELYVWLSKEKKWVLTRDKNDYTELMWKEHRKKEHKNRICKGDYVQFMQHDRKHKRSGGGVSPCNAKRVFTDYECSKKPFHDFRRCFN